MSRRRTSVRMVVATGSGLVLAASAAFVVMALPQAPGEAAAPPAIPTAAPTGARMQLDPIMIPVVLGTVPVQRFFTLVLDLDDERAAARLCAVLPRVRDAVVLAYANTKVAVEGDGRVTATALDDRVRVRINEALGAPALSIFDSAGNVARTGGAKFAGMRTCQQIKS